jgi:hypothetical protein
MKNKFMNVKNALISAGIAVFTGVLLLGVNAAIGEAPTYQPPGNAVSPTFGGLDVTGNATVDGILEVVTISDPTGNTVVIDDGLIVNGSGSRIGSDKIGDYININAELRANHTILNAGHNNDGKVKINDDLVVTGLSTLEKNLIVKNGNSDANIVLYGPASTMKITPTSITNERMPLILQNGKGFPIQIGNSAQDSNLILTGSISDLEDSVTINDDLEVKYNLNVEGAIKNDSMKFVMGISVPAPVSIDDDLYVTGHITADSIGTFNFPAPASIDVLADSYGIITQNCPNDYQVVACSSPTIHTTFLEYFHIVVYKVGNGCIAKGFNASTEVSPKTLRLQVQAHCWDPSF